MVTKPKIRINKYMLWFAEQYYQMRSFREKERASKLHVVKYKLITIPEEYQKTGRLELALADRPGDILPPLTLEEIYNDKALMEGLHPLDAITVCEFHYKATAATRLKSKKKLVNSVFDLLKNKYIFRILDSETGESKEVDPQELYFDPNTKNDFNTADGMLIGYSACEAHHKRVNGLQSQPTTLKIIGQGERQELFVEQQETGEKITMQAEEIFYNPNLKNNFSKRDREIISFVAGSEFAKRTNRKSKY